MKEENKLSPMMRHYREMKAKYPDTVLFYRLGDFYEMFFEDAIEVSRILDLTLTGRDCGLAERAPMCGVPYHAVDGYIAKLVKSGKKVAICEQLSVPGEKPGMVDRDVIRVVTAGTVTDEEMLESGVNNYLASIYVASKGVGLAWADVSTGDVRVAELSQSETGKLESLLMSASPREIIGNTAGAELVRSFPSANSGKLPKAQSYYDYAFDRENAARTAEKFYGVYSTTALGLSSDLSLSAVGGLLFYIESTQKRALSHILPPKTVRLSAEMFLDYNTKRNLELTENIGDQGKTGSLLWVLDRTRTNMGARAMRRAVTEPLTDEKEINDRLDAVAELAGSIGMRAELSTVLNGIRDMERLSNKIAYNTINPRESEAVAYSLSQLPAVLKILQKAASPKLLELRARINPLSELRETIERAIKDNPPTVLKDGGYIRPGYSEELDRYRSAQSSAKQWLAEYEAKEREATGLKTLKIGYNRVFGYYIEVSNSYLAQVPYRFQRKQTLTTGERFITDELKQMEEVITGAEEKALVLEERLYAEIKELLSNSVRTLQENARAIAELDVLCSFAVVAVENDYVRPTIGGKTERIYIKAGRHPVVEALKKSNEFVPNDSLLDQDSRTLVITGPNMAGKSTYMRQVALIVLMAHIGSFVPATEAEMPIVDRIFTRIGASDNLAFGQSTFMVEMTEVAEILNAATEKSLLILDEIGRGTSTLDGLAIAWAIIEHVALKIKAYTLFATHYHELSELENLIPSLKNYHVLIKESEGEITFLYKLARGGASKSFGIEVASLAGVRKTVIERAKKIIAALDESGKTGEVKIKALEQPTEAAVPTSQMGFFGETDDNSKEIMRILSDTDVDSCTPIQALTILSQLSGLVKSNRKQRKKK